MLKLILLENMLLFRSEKGKKKTRGKKKKRLQSPEAWKLASGHFRTVARWLSKILEIVIEKDARRPVRN